MPIYTYIPLTPEDCKKMFATIIEAELLKHKLIQIPEAARDDWLDIHAVATLLGREKSRIYSYIRAGIIPAHKLKKTRGLKFKRSEITAAIEQLNLNKNIKTKKIEL